jgi:hypothetical protein
MLKCKSQKCAPRDAVTLHGDGGAATTGGGRNKRTRLGIVPTLAGRKRNIDRRRGLGKDWRREERRAEHEDVLLVEEGKLVGEFVPKRPHDGHTRGVGSVEESVQVGKQSVPLPQGGLHSRRVLSWSNLYLAGMAPSDTL